MCIELGCRKYKNIIANQQSELDGIIEQLDILQYEYQIIGEKLELYEHPIPAPQYLEDIDYSELYSILTAEFPSAALHLADRDYRTTSKTELERFVKHDLTDIRQYITEYYDCDDFSYALMGAISNPEWGALPFAIVWTEMYKTADKKILTGRHAVNCFVDKKRQVWIIEPQSDWIGPCPDNWTPYFVVM